MEAPAPKPGKKPWKKKTAGDVKHCAPYQTHSCKDVCPKGKKHGIARCRRNHKAGQTCFHGNECLVNHGKAT